MLDIASAVAAMCALYAAAEAADRSGRIPDTVDVLTTSARGYRDRIRARIDQVVPTGYEAAAYNLIPELVDAAREQQRLIIARESLTLALHWDDTIAEVRRELNERITHATGVYGDRYAKLCKLFPEGTNV